MNYLTNLTKTGIYPPIFKDDELVHATDFVLILALEGVMLAFTASSGEIFIPVLFHELLDQFDQNWYLSPHFQG